MSIFKRIVAIKINRKSPLSRWTKLLFILVPLFIISTDAFGQIEGDTLRSDTTTVDSVLESSVADTATTAASDTLRTSDSVLKSEVHYSAKDSIANDLINKRVFLYGDASVSYENITLKADHIIYDFSSYTVHATGVQDTAGAWVGEPVFTQGNTTFEAHEMDYNFKSKKAYVKQVSTEVIEGVLTGERVKTVDDNKVIYIRHGEYCPCEDPNAKTRFKIGKLKVIKDDKIITGPGYLALGKIPTPLVFPFGFFPNTEDKQAGLIIPSYGNGQKQGYFLNGLGFYMPFGDRVDTKILADLYSRGSWGLGNITRYKQRYKYTGEMNLEYNVRKTGDKDLNTSGESRNFFVKWRHNQDRSARPNSNFSADVNAGSSTNFVNNLNSSQDNYLTNTFSSNIRYDKSFYDSPWTFGLSAGHDQNSLTGVYNFNLPTVSVNKARTFPLADIFGKSSGSKQAFYEKIGWTYSANFQNRLSAQEEELSFNNWHNLKDKFQNGIRHQTALTTSLKAGPISINPNIRYSERWYMRTYGRSIDEETGAFVKDTLQGFDRSGDWSMGASATTKFYGMFSFRGRTLKAIRHTATPSLTYTYSPDFDPRVFGFYGTDGALSSYSPYDGTLYGGPPSGRSQTLSFNLANNLEAKVLSRRDTTSRFKKVPILENLSIGGSYNFAADSMNFSNIGVNGRTNIAKIVNINFGASFDPYTYVVRNVDDRLSVQRIDRLEYQRSGTLANFQSGNLSMDIGGLNSALFKRKKSEVIQEEDEGDSDKDTFIRGIFNDFSVPWDLRAGYVLNVRTDRKPIVEQEGYSIRDSLMFTQSVQFSGGFTLFEKVRISFQSGYDFVLKELTPTTFNATVDLNCWELSARVVPFGLRRNYNIALNIKASILKDLKLEKKRSLSSDEKFFM